MDRREALKRVGVLMGGAVSLPLASGVLSGCQPSPSSAGYTLQTLTEPQSELVATIAEHIIPTTDTPGARAAQVHTFVDRMLTEWYPLEDKERFLAGLAEVDQMAQDLHELPFGECTEAEQVAILRILDNESRQAAPGADAPFFQMMKEQTLMGYYTSEIGATQELQHVPAAGRFDPDIEIDADYRAYS